MRGGSWLVGSGDRAGTKQGQVEPVLALLCMLGVLLRPPHHNSSVLGTA